MGTARQWTALALALACGAWGLACGFPAHAGEIKLSPAEAQHVAARQLLIRATLDSSQRRGTVRAAVRIDAPPDVVFQMLTTCADAMQYVPHMRLCRVRDQAPDNSWQLVEHEIDFGWYAPRIKYVIAFRQVSGDFKANEGRWELEPSADGSHTVLLYRAYLDPPGYIPNWVLRSRFRREMPQMLTDLRKRCETEQTLRAKADHAP
jgi:uncharacterized membrane protein